MHARLDNIRIVVARTGWTAELGYEIYLRDAGRGDDLWERIMEAGKPFHIRPTGPSDRRRMEAGIFNYGSDMTLENNPFEITGLERLVEEQEAGRPVGRVTNAVYSRRLKENIGYAPSTVVRSKGVAPA